jgi:hypothetical protein
VWDDIVIEMARLERELYVRAVAKVRAGQRGEAWVGLEERLGSPEGEVEAERHHRRVAA